MHEQKSTGTSEMKAFGQDLLDLGVRYIKTGKAWLNYRRSEMSHDNGRGGNRRHDQQNQQSRESGRTGQQGQQEYGQYRGSDYDDPRAEGGYDFGDGRQPGRQGDGETGRYAGYPESGGYRSHDQHSQGQNPQHQQWRDRQNEHSGRGGHGADAHNIGGQSRNTGDHGGYADEQDSRGRTQSGSRRNAQDQYGDLRGQGGSSQRDYGQSGHTGTGQGNDGQYGQGVQGQGNDDRSGRTGYGQSDFGQSGQRSGQSGERGSTQGHRGKGPRSYSRSDERLAEDLNEQLMHDDDIDASDISVRVENGEVTLEGTVTERWMKHAAEDLAERCSGVKDVDNRIRVRKPEPGESAPGGSSSMKSSGEGAGTNSGIKSAGSHGGVDGVGIGGSTTNPGSTPGKSP